MTERAARLGLLVRALATGAAFALVACGSQEDALRREIDDLRYEVAQSRQYNADLKRRIQLAEARGRVLAALVQGLTASDAQGRPVESGQGLLRAHASLATLDRELEQLAATLEGARDDLHALRAQREALEAELARARTAIEQARAQQAAADQRAYALRDVVLRFKDMMSAGSLAVTLRDNRMVLELPEALLFPRGRATLSPRGRALLSEVATVLRAVPDREFQIAGHAARGPADAGAHASPWQLSAARAVLVTAYLVEQGVPAARLSAAAYGDSRLVAAASQAESDRLSRRIEIVLLPRLDELPDLSSVDALLAGAATDTSAGQASAATAPEKQPAPADGDDPTEPAARDDGAASDPAP